LITPRPAIGAAFGLGRRAGPGSPGTRGPAMAKARRPAAPPHLFEQFHRALRPQLDRIFQTERELAVAVRMERLIREVQPAISDETRIRQRAEADNVSLRAESPKVLQEVIDERNEVILRMASEGTRPKEIGIIIRRHWPGTSDAAVRQIISRAKRL
jgi:hypothetical protein